MITIACVACLDPSISIHTPGFLRAVGLAEEFALGPDIKVDLYNDFACKNGAIQAAQDIIAAKPDVVVGHFASSAAQGAAPLYEAAGLPLILPAATRADLTEHAGVFRVCDNDHDYMDWLCSAVDRPIHAGLSDGSAHGDSIVANLKTSRFYQPQSPANTVLVSGLYKPSLAMAAQIAASTIILTDDADAPALADDLCAAGLNFAQSQVLLGALDTTPVGQLAHWIEQIQLTRHDALPGAYFWETIAALQIAVRFAGASHTYDTVLGPIGFDQRGEARPNSFSLRRIAPQRRACAA